MVYPSHCILSFLRAIWSSLKHEVAVFDFNLAHFSSGFLNNIQMISEVMNHPKTIILSSLSNKISTYCMWTCQFHLVALRCWPQIGLALHSGFWHLLHLTQRWLPNLWCRNVQLLQPNRKYRNRKKTINHHSVIFKQRSSLFWQWIQ